MCVNVFWCGCNDNDFIYFNCDGLWFKCVCRNREILNFFLVVIIGMMLDGWYGFLYVGMEKGLWLSLLVNLFYKYVYLLEGCWD